MIRNLKSKLKAMSSSSPLHSQDLESIASPINESSLSLIDTGNLEYIEVVRRGRVAQKDDLRARGDFGGKVIEGSEGAFVRKRTIYGMGSSYGKVDLSQLPALDFSKSSWWTRLDANFNIHNIVFLDTETTGLAGGTGTYAFLIGLGYIDDQGLVVEQYLMRDFDEEYPMLKAVMETLKKFRVLVTFNGKSFDWPLLESRLIYPGLELYLGKMHIWICCTSPEGCGASVWKAVHFHVLKKISSAISERTIFQVLRFLTYILSIWKAGIQA